MSKKLALIVATSQYQDAALRQLVAPAQDAESLARVLGNSAIGGFQVQTLVNEPSHKVSLEIENFCDNRTHDDLLLLYFSCHGIKDADGQLYFATADTVLVQHNLRRATAVGANFVNQVMSRSRSRRQILLLDCCYSGAFKDGMLAKADSRVGVGEQFEGRGRVVLTASDALQYSFEGEQVQGEGARSVFTRMLVQGLETGEADLDRDGLYSLDEVYDYVYARVSDAQPEQKPMKMGYAEGRIFIGSNPRPRPADLPPELQESLEDPRKWVRLGAVQELEKLLATRSKGRILAARNALTALAKADDSFEVRTKAEKCLAMYSEQLAPEQSEAERVANENAITAEHMAREQAEPPRLVAEQAEAEDASRDEEAKKRAAAEKFAANVAEREAEKQRAREATERQRLALQEREMVEAAQREREKFEAERLAEKRAPVAEERGAAAILPPTRIWFVTLASSLGTMIAWYDFFVFSLQAVALSRAFYPPGSATFAYFAYLFTFAVGFLVRPLGALFFGRIGDVIGRRYAFLFTLFLMGGATALIGALPTYSAAGWFAPIALLLLRMLQGLALGGEYGGAAVYVAEHVPDNKRGFYTSFIQAAATLGLCLAMAVTLKTQWAMSVDDFLAYGWRIPLLISVILVGIALYLRLKIKESPVFAEMKNTGMSSAQPVRGALTHWDNNKRIAISILGVSAGQGVVWYMGSFYALFFLQTILRIQPAEAIKIVAYALLLGTPFCVLFGVLSDKIGRKKIMMAGCLIAVVTYYPIYGAMQKAANNNVSQLGSQRNSFTNAPVLTALTQGPDGQLQPAHVAYDATRSKLIFLLFIQMIFVSMVCGPIAAYLVEAFPAEIRCTSLSFSYHIGNGVFGGLVPLIGLYTCAATGNIYAGLWYPMILASITFVVGSIFLKETRHTKIWERS